MKALHLVFHPNMETSRVNKIWAAKAKAAGLHVRDMYQLYPDFKIDVAEEQRQLVNYDRIVMQFPFYWYNCPPLMKKWLDDVLTFGFAYGPGDDLKLKGKELLLCVSVGGAQAAYMPGGYNGFSVTEFLRPFQQTAFLCKMKYLSPFWLHGAVRVKDDEIAAAGDKMVAHVQDPSLSDIWNLQTRIFRELGVIK
jgi:glutathione-regulated potassium-efflux system ancillary protein KefG